MMTFSGFLRVSGLSAIAGGLLYLSIPIWFLFISESIGYYVDYLGTFLILWGLFGFYLYQIKATGKLGFFSFTIAFLGTVLWSGYKWLATFVIPDLLVYAPELLDNMPPTVGLGMFISLILFISGWFLFAIVTAWKGMLPRWGAIILAIGLVSDFLPYLGYIAQPLAGIGIAWLGYVLWKENKETDLSP